MYFILCNIYVDNNNPGPSDYEQKELIGRLFNSKFRASEGKTMYVLLFFESFLLLGTITTKSTLILYYHL